MAIGGEAVTIHVDVGTDGRLGRVRFMRWRGDGASHHEPFVVDEWSDERTFDGYTIPTCFRAGWRIGEPEEFPFYYVRIREVVYI